MYNIVILNRFSRLQIKGGQLGLGIRFVPVLLFVSIWEYLGRRMTWTLLRTTVTFLTSTVYKQLRGWTDGRYRDTNSIDPC